MRASAARPGSGQRAQLMKDRHSSVMVGRTAPGAYLPARPSIPTQGSRRGFMKSPRPRPSAVELDEVDGYPRLRLCGECGTTTAGQLQQRLNGLIEGGRLQILLDTRDISYLDPTCHAILADAIDR